MNFRSIILIFISATVVACSALPTSASVTRDSPLAGSPTSGFAAVGMFGDSSSFYSSGTAFANGNWVLTARHNVTTDASITGPLKSPAQLRFGLGSSTYIGEALYADFGADLALLKLSTTAPTFAELRDPNGGSELGQTFTAVGFGGTDSNGDGTWGPGGYGLRRLFENRVDNIQSGSLIGQGTVLRYDFDKTSGDAIGPLEGIAGPGDSGGGVFLNDGSGFVLTAVISSSGSPVQGATGSNVRLADHYDTILSIVPEPSTFPACGAITAYLLSRAARRNFRRNEMSAALPR